MNTRSRQDEPEHFYRLSYILIPLPIIASVIFMIYVWVIKDTQVISYCAVAQDAKAYQRDKLQAADFQSLESVTLDVCKKWDDEWDAGDGRTSGLVRWFICDGTTCGPGWEKVLKQ